MLSQRQRLAGPIQCPAYQSVALPQGGSALGPSQSTILKSAAQGAAKASTFAYASDEGRNHTGVRVWDLRSVDPLKHLARTVEVTCSARNLKSAVLNIGKSSPIQVRRHAGSRTCPLTRALAACFRRSQRVEPGLAPTRAYHMGKPVNRQDEGAWMHWSGTGSAKTRLHSEPCRIRWAALSRKVEKACMMVCSLIVMSAKLTPASALGRDTLETMATGSVSRMTLREMG